MIYWSPGMKISEIEKAIILHALRFYSGNKQTTAFSLGISLRTLYSRLNEYGHGDGETQGPKNVPDATEGIHVESHVEIPTQQSLSVQKREKIQKMSSR